MAIVALGGLRNLPLGIDNFFWPLRYEVFNASVHNACLSRLVRTIGVFGGSLGPLEVILHLV